MMLHSGPAGKINGRYYPWRKKRRRLHYHQSSQALEAPAVALISLQLFHLSATNLRYSRLHLTAALQNPNY
ncbi:hypothetical protein L1987_83988 [Smallanthus sonchifolius]|uniref:Uncharacterized protein n=1 Tax=Smallanthus sonchifolius TaxID=185202 RepID=A0ACB8YCP5_9ASTR|nr:hypothetical protein L1987_83988 [Smallanthus sonchifolius]